MSNYYSIEFVEARLEEWARWYEKQDNSGTGYPKKSIFHHIMTKGIVPLETTWPRCLPTHEAAEEMNALITELMQHEKEMGMVLYQYYLGREKTLPLKARAIGMCETKFKNLLRMAKAWLSGSLSLLHRDKFIGGYHQQNIS